MILATPLTNFFHYSRSMRPRLLIPTATFSETFLQCNHFRLNLNNLTKPCELLQLMRPNSQIFQAREHFALVAVRTASRP